MYCPKSGPKLRGKWLRQVKRLNHCRLLPIQPSQLRKHSGLRRAKEALKRGDPNSPDKRVRVAAVDEGGPISMLHPEAGVRVPGLQRRSVVFRPDPDDVGVGARTVAAVSA
jgi:hypothetical protein